MARPLLSCALYASLLVIVSYADGQAAAFASHRHATRKLMQADDTSTPTNISTRTNIIDNGANLADSAFTELAQGCVYGNWCGGGCHGEGGDPIDELDAACQAHDECLGSNDPSITQYASSWSCSASGSVNCYCDGTLRGAADTAASGSQCSWWEVWCGEDAKVLGGQSISAAMNYKLYCGSCTDGLPPDYVEYVPTTTTASDTGGDDSTPDSSSDSTPSCGASVDTDTDYSGGDLAGDSYVGAETSDECCQACYSDDSCGAFTWTPSNDACGGSGCCFLKASDGWEALFSTGAISGHW